tara:strand:- start:1830 stop:2435 length:606 start_codon:yes stop_codon:yes gene_type:complete
MTTEKLEINPNFFNKLDSLYKRKTTKITTNPKVKKTFGSTPISVISDNTKKKKTKVLHIPDNTQTKKKTMNILNSDIISSSDFTSNSDNIISSDEEFEIIEKRKPKIKKRKKYKKRKKSRQEINNSFHLYDDDYSAHIVAKLDKRNPLYNKIINLPYHELINISYDKKNNTKYFDTYLVICFMSGLLIGITITVLTFSILH